jgi:prepilin-type N-terminal cleavage/methylation domain-containing protein
MRSPARGFTLVELLVTFTVLVIALCGILLTYINMFFLTDLTRDCQQANALVQAKMEEVLKTDYSLVTPFALAYDANSRFETDPAYNVLLKKGVIKAEVSAVAGFADLKEVRITACFRSRNRIIGEDANLNGVLDTGEDTYINNLRIDSTIESVTLITRTIG